MRLVEVRADFEVKALCLIEAEIVGVHLDSSLGTRPVDRIPH